MAKRSVTTVAASLFLAAVAIAISPVSALAGGMWGT